MKLNPTELANVLRGLKKGAHAVTLTAHTLTKAGAEKRATINGFLGVDYEAGVNRRLERAGETPNFVAQDPRWGHGGPIVVEHKGSFYLRINVGRTLQKDFFRDGMQISAEEAGDSNRDESGMKLRKYKLQSIRSITMGGKTYMVTQ